MNQSIHSNAAVRMFTYTENGVYIEFTAPGGAKCPAEDGRFCN